jgi:hypothetical protein
MYMVLRKHGTPFRMNSDCVGNRRLVLSSADYANCTPTPTVHRKRKERVLFGVVGDLAHCATCEPGRTLRSISTTSADMA